MASKTTPSTPKLSDAARILNIPDGIATTGFGRVRRVADRLGIRFDRWQEGIGTLMLAKRADGTYASSVGGIGHEHLPDRQARPSPSAPSSSSCA